MFGISVHNLLDRGEGGGGKWATSWCACVQSLGPLAIPVALMKDVIKNSFYDKDQKDKKTTTTTAETGMTTTTGVSTTVGLKTVECGATITVTYGTIDASEVNVGKKVASKKLIAINPWLFNLCDDIFTSQCKFGYIFPGGVVNGVDGKKATNAIMYYVLETKTWALFEATFGQVPVEYAYGVDLNLATPGQSTTFPWVVGPEAVNTGSQTVQGISCGGVFKWSL
eukprot:GHVS01095924.1.p1 GENE.GHVS01095924.1~~GHVS01095924.1.p1  ORF type:complete len:225 (+),score=20.29 GHVS01095924.1:411-1085(+)